MTLIAIESYILQKQTLIKYEFRHNQAVIPSEVWLCVFIVSGTNVVNLSPKALIFQGYRALFFFKNF